MTQPKTFLVGFDRFIALSWAEFALEMTVHTTDDKSVQIKKLKDYLSIFMKGKDATRKTANVLTRLWIETYPALTHSRDQAINLYQESAQADHLVLHWGMSLAIFPLFRDVALQIGKLCQLQGSFSRQEIHTRLLEKYSNISTLPRSIDRIIQTMADWGTIANQSSGTYISPSIGIESPKLQNWLIALVVQATSGHRVVLNDIYRLPEIFPFSMINGEQSPIPADTRVERDGNNTEYLVKK